MTKRSLMAGVALALMLAGCGPTPEESVANARTAFAQNDFAAARVSLISALEEMPGDAEALELLARTQLALQDGEGASATLDRLAGINAKHKDLPTLRAEADILRGQYQQAIDGLKGADTATADRLRALAYIGLEDIENAEGAFKEGLARGGANAPLLASYARFQLATGQIESARELAQRASAADAKNVDAALVTARIAAAQNRLAEALVAYDRVLELHSGNFEGLLGKAAVLAEQGDLKAAREIADSLAKDDPENMQIAFLKAGIAGEEGKWDEVRNLLQSRERTFGDEPTSQLLYGEAMLRLGLPAQAISWFEPLLKRYPDTRQLRVLLAEAQMQTGNRDAALATLQPIVIRPDATPEELTLAAKVTAGTPAQAGYAARARFPAPEWLGGELAKADTALRNGQWEDAAHSYELILARSRGTNAMVLNNLSFAKAQLGDRKAALDLALRAYKLEPDHVSVLDTAGWLLVQDGQTARGVAMLEKAAKIDPNNKTVARHLSEATRN